MLQERISEIFAKKETKSWMRGLFVLGASSIPFVVCGGSIFLFSDIANCNQPFPGTSEFYSITDFNPATGIERRAVKYVGQDSSTEWYCIRNERGNFTDTMNLKMGDKDGFEIGYGKNGLVLHIFIGE